MFQLSRHNVIYCIFLCHFNTLKIPVSLFSLKIRTGIFWTFS